MSGNIRRRISMAARALDFARARSARHHSFDLFVHQLETCVGRAEALADQEEARSAGEGAAVARQVELRRTIHEDLLRHLSRVSSLAALGQPELKGAFVIPRSNVSHAAFLDAAQLMLSAAIAHQELLVPFGLGAKVMPELTAALEELSVVVARAPTGRMSQASVRGELMATLDEAVALVARMDGIVREHFSDDPAEISAWGSARSVLGTQQMNGANSGAAAA